MARVRPVLAQVAADQWMLVHRDLRDLPRVRAVMNALVQLFQEERATLEGRSAEDRVGTVADGRPAAVPA
jgi:hypothetical protein